MPDTFRQEKEAHPSETGENVQQDRFTVLLRVCPFYKVYRLHSAVENYSNSGDCMLLCIAGCAVLVNTECWHHGTVKRV